jgi:hypothetical protein
VVASSEPSGPTIVRRGSITGIELAVGNLKDRLRANDALVLALSAETFAFNDGF